MTYDVIIVGAGAAGCVLAARLSENPQRAVLLLEAGPDYATEASLPPEIRNGFNPTLTHDWGLASDPGALGRAIALPRAKLVGGCSATNATIALRGTPADYDEWAALGNAEWSYSSVLPIFRRLENDADFAGGGHGRDGPLPIRRYSDAELLPEQRAFLAACESCGHARVADHNAPDALGAGRVPVNTLGGVRRSAALSWLGPARTRKNLTIRADTIVDRVAWEEHRASGVCVAGGETIIARTTVIAAGAYGSPAILLRSGVGPASQLRDLGITLVEEVPGVGGNLLDHPMILLRFAAPAPDRSGEVPGCQAMLTLRSGDGTAGHDLQIFPWALARVDPTASPTGAQFRMYVALVKPRSTGRVYLRTSDPTAPPGIDHGYLTATTDLVRLRTGIREALRLCPTPALAPFALQPLEGVRPDASDVELEGVIRATVRTYYHPVGTCRMGPANDSMAVVDSRARVRGVESLFVVDASIMPSIPAANTHLPTLMVAERCAAWLDEEV